MAYSFLPCDREQSYLMPASMRDWLPGEDLAWFVIDVVETMDLGRFYSWPPRSTPANPGPGGADDALFAAPEPSAVARSRSDPRGRAAYDPKMMVAVLLYAYATGVRSSRQIERCCRRNIDFRILAANHLIDHATIARFRAHHQQGLAGLFGTVLALCQEAGLGKVGVVALDGTKIAGSASRQATLSRAQIEAEVARMLKEAAEVDAAEDALYGDARGDELPPELADPRTRQAHLQEALRRLEAKRTAAREAEEAAEAEKAIKRAERANAQRTARPREHTKRVKSVAAAQAELKIAEGQAEALAQRRAKIEAEAAERGRKPPGTKPDFTPRVTQAKAELERARAKEEQEAQADTINTTDPDSGLMKTRDGFTQGFNGQVVVTEDQIIVAAEVTQDHGDVEQFVPMVQAAQANLRDAGFQEGIGVVLADAGYASAGNFAAPGPDRAINTTRAWKLRRRLKEEGYREGPPPEGATPAEAMEHRLLTRAGSALYAKRGQTVEPVFGQIKEARGFRRFSRRGLPAVDSEWKLVAAAHNLLKLYTHTAKLAATPA